MYIVVPLSDKLSLIRWWLNNVFMLFYGIELQLMSLSAYSQYFVIKLAYSFGVYCEIELFAYALLHFLLGGINSLYSLIVTIMLLIGWWVIGTIAKGAALLHQVGAREVYACCTHAVFRYLNCYSKCFFSLMFLWHLVKKVCYMLKFIF